MTTDPLALLDTLDGLHKAATPGEWIDMGDTEPWPGTVIATTVPDGGVTPVCIDPEADDRPSDRACIAALHNAYPRLAQALRTALTPTTDGEREALARVLAPFAGRRLTYDDGITDDQTDPPEQGKPAALYLDGEWVADFDTDMMPKEKRDDIGRAIVAVFKHAPVLLAERAKATDAARERAAIVADLREAARGIRSAPGSAVLLLVNGAVADAFMSAADRYESGAHNKVTP